ncbi:MAG TPA: hypothetical protein ENK16_01970, partial [Chromatiales bacterium]|nr:hypothetical protein [Chromatiales bacterium]
MSFILDALRKSETERQRQTAPGIIDTRHAGTAQKRSLWVPILTLVLAANAALAAYWLLTRTDHARTASPVSDSPAVQAQPASSADDATRVRPLAMELKPAPAGSAPETAAVPDTKPAITASSSPPAGPTTPPAPADTGPKLLPSMQQLILAGILTLPQLHLDIHVYSEQPQQRFVFVNMRKYREGERL